MRLEIITRKSDNQKAGKRAKTILTRGAGL